MKNARVNPAEVAAPAGNYSQSVRVPLGESSSLAQLALAWVLAQGEDIVPIPGTKRREYFEANIAAASLELTPEDVARIADSLPVDSVAGERYPSKMMELVNR